MIKIAICDDEKECTSKIEDVLLETASNHGVKIEVSVFFDGEKLVDYMVQNEERFDLIFLDIEMGKMDGIETAKRIREFDEMVYLIYVTSHKNYAIDAYDVQPFQFIVKPFEERMIADNFMRIYEKINRGNFYFEYKKRMVFYKVLVNDIVYFKSDRRVIQIHMNDGSVHEYYDKLNKIEEKMLKSKMSFWRVHRSYLVNARYIVEKAYDHVVLFNGENLLISEDRRKEMNMQYTKMVEQNML